MTITVIEQIVGIRIKRKEFYNVFIDNEKLKKMMDEKEMINEKDIPKFKRFLKSDEDPGDTEFYKFCPNIERTTFNFNVCKLAHDVDPDEDLIIGKIICTLHLEIVNKDKFPTSEEIANAHKEVGVILSDYGFSTNNIQIYNVQNDCQCCS